MPEILITRRAALAAGGVATLLPGLGAAQAPPAFHRFMVGSLPVTIAQDGNRTIADATRGLVVNAEPPAVAAALLAGGIPGPAAPSPYNQTAVRTAAGVVLFDVGFGPGGPPGTGQMLDSLRAAGIDPSEIRTVAFTHFHGDHVGGLLDASGGPAFPNAAIVVPEREWAYWMDDGEASRAPAARQPAFANVRRRFAPYAARVQTIAPGGTVAPGVTAVASFGHSPGHTSYLIADGGAQCLVIGDAVVLPAVFMANPEWYPIFDMDPPQAIATRRALLDRAVADRLTVIGYHFELPATGRVERAGSGFRLVAG